jgi:hypothetical protein
VNFLEENYVGSKPKGSNGEFQREGTKLYPDIGLVGLWCFNGIFNNISVISWRSILLVAETGENHRPVASH